MSPRRVLAVARRIASTFRRDHRSLGLLVVAPILVLSLVGALWGSTTTQTVRVAVATDRTVGQPMVDALRRSGGLEVSTATYAEGQDRLRAGEVDAVVSAGVATLRPDVVVDLEGSDPFRTASALQAIQRGLLGAFSSAATPSLRIQYVHGGAEYTLLDYLAPLLVGLFAFFFTFLLSAVSFLRERTSGTLERLLATPLRRGELVVGYLAGFGLFALIQAAIIIGFTVLVLNVRYRGNIGTIFLIEAMLVIVAVGLGLFVSAFARNELQAVQFIPVILLPQIFLSGLLVPVDQLPDLLRPIAAVLPLTYANEALRAVMIKGFPLDDPLIVRDVVVLAAFGTLAVAGAIASIRREVA